MPARPMFRSPHKKRNVGVLPSTITLVPSVGDSKKITPACWPFKKSVAKSTGVSGNKNRDKHPIQPPGYPSGICLGSGKEASCRCGKHNRSAAGRR